MESEHTKLLERKLIACFVVLIVMLPTSSWILILIEGSNTWSFFDAFYFVLITLTTIGFSETHPLTQNGRIFTVMLIFCGLGIFTYAISNIIEILLEGHLTKKFRTHKMNKKIQRLEQHYLICGYGKIARYLCDYFHSLHVPFVVMDNHPENIKILQTKDFLFIEGKPTANETLLQGGIKKAQMLLALTPSDPENLFITLTGRLLNPTIHIISRYQDFETQIKLMQSGANDTFSPYISGGYHLIHTIFRQCSKTWEQPLSTTTADIVTIPHHAGLTSSWTIQYIKNIEIQYSIHIPAWLDKQGNHHVITKFPKNFKKLQKLLVVGNPRNIQNFCVQENYSSSLLDKMFLKATHKN